MAEKLVHGVYAAVLTPRRPDDSVDEAAFAALLQFLSQREIRGVAVNGATGEFCLSTPTHLRALFSVLNRHNPGHKVLCGIGGAGLAQVLELGRIAEGEGAQAVLLPMPYFFPYQQTDLEQFVHIVASSLTIPILLYNLPSFTTAIETETVLRLLRDVPNLIGIKDSGSSLQTLRRLKTDLPAACRIVGNDSMLIDALREEACDGVVSGVACVLPELIRDIFRAGSPASSSSASSHQLADLAPHLDAFIQHITHLPVPWGLKFAAQARGILTASFAQPVSPLRAKQGTELMEWFQQWQHQLPSLAQLTQR